MSEEETFRGKSMDPVSAALPGHRLWNETRFKVCIPRLPRARLLPLALLPSASLHPHVRSRCCFSYLTDSQPSYSDDWQQPSTLHVRDALRSAPGRLALFALPVYLV